ncbi:MAG: glycosyltransferase family 2 protein [Paracoccaceae bacterium]
MTALAVVTLRNEGAFLLEWLAHHKAVGFTDFLVFSNDCQDGTDEMLDRLADLGVLHHVRNAGPYAKGGVQFTALNHASSMDIVQQADWILPLDIDEFVNIHAGDGTLQALWTALPDATAITLTWRLFGNAGQIRYRDAPIAQTFTQAAPVDMPWPWRAAMFKTLYRNDGTYQKLGVHRPRKPHQDRLTEAAWFDGEGRRLPDAIKTRQIFSPFGRSNTRLVQLNHYPLGAMESFILKADRGRAVHSDDILGLDYWIERNWNTDQDTSISRYDGQKSIHLKSLMDDPDLARLHHKAVDWRHARFHALMLQDGFRALFGRLLMTPESRPVSRDAAQFLLSFAHKAQSSNL